MYHIMKHHFKPSPDYSFPKNANARSFQYSWLNKFTWLAYSKQENGGFCLPCVLFCSTTVYHGSEPGILVSKPLTNFKKALEILRKHIEKDHHQASIVRLDEFIKVMSNQQPSITSALNRAVADQIAKSCCLSSRLLFYVDGKISVCVIISLILKEILLEHIIMAIFCLSFILGLILVTLSLETILQKHLKMPHTHLQFFRIR